MFEITYDEIKINNYQICETCGEALEKDNDHVTVKGREKEVAIDPMFWKHSDKDVYHALIMIGDRYHFLCKTDEFDNKTLKRVRSIANEDHKYWTLSVKGQIYNIVEYNDAGYEIISEDGKIVKNEEVEAMVFNHMISRG